MNNETKYSAKLLVRDLFSKGNFKFIGTVSANSIADLKEKARRHALGWNERGRVYIKEENTGRELAVNA